MASSENTYDFVVVGGGPAGCLLASRLAETLTHQSVLLIDAGGKNADPGHQAYGERHWTFATAPGYNWGYKTVPQEYLEGRAIDYSRGKGLGGSTAVNFCVFTRGPKANYEQWAQLVDDDAWNWERVLQRFKKLETFDQPLKDYKPYADITASAHGFDGPLKLSLPHKWDDGFGTYMTLLEARHPLNLDHNSGNPLGNAVCQISASAGRRITASDAFLSPAPANLTIMTGAPVEKVLFQDQKAVGVHVQGKDIYARRDVILSAGAVDSPKLLLLSGIGPERELAKHGIPVVKNLPGVGQNLRDHLWLEVVTTQKPGTHHRTSHISSPVDLEKARLQYATDEMGQLSGYYLPQVISYLKSDRILASEEFHQLPPEIQESFRADTKPNYEMLSHIPSFSVKEPETYLASLVAFMGSQAAGEVSLHSKDPSDPPTIDPKFLSHPFDRRVAIESVREALELLDLEALAKDRSRLAAGPGGRSDEEIMEYIQHTGISMWHMCGTVKMGRPTESDACVDKDFRVIGTHGLRVVDMSVAPFLPDAHTQAIAYMIGEVAAEKIIAEHDTQA